MPGPLRPSLPTMLGVPNDDGSSFARGAAAGPAAIRAALTSDATNLWTEDGRDLTPVLQDAGDVAFEAGDPLVAIEQRVSALLATDCMPLCLGGDHAVTLPILRAMHGRHGALTVLHIDAHPDLYPELDGKRYSHASPFARALEEGLVSRLVQVGLRAITGAQRGHMERFDVEVIDMRAWRAGARPSLGGPVYLSLDLDGIDPAFAPGVIHREAGGLTSSEVVGLIQSCHILGADIVELAPDRDPAGITAPLAAKLVKEIAAAMLRFRQAS